MQTLKRLASFRFNTPVGPLIKSLVLWTILVLAVVAEFLLVGRILSILSLGTSLLWLTAGVLALPLVAVAAFFRLPTGRKRLRTYYTVKLVGSTNTSPGYELNEITSLIRRELALWLAKARESATQAGPTGGTLTVSQVTIPIEWLWNVIRQRLIGASEVIIETTLISGGESAKLESWARGYGRSPLIVSQTLLSQESIGTTVQKLALDLVAAIDPEQGAAIKSDLQDFGGALLLLKSKPPSFGGDLSIARMYMESGQEERASEHLRTIRERYLASQRKRYELDLFEAELLTRTGKYAEAKKVLDALQAPTSRIGELLDALAPRWSRERSSQKRRVCKLLGDCDRNCERPDAALVAYSRVEELLLAEFRRLVGSTKLDNLKACLRRSVLCAHPGIGALLGELDDLIESKAICLSLQSVDPTPEYDRLLDVVLARSEIASSSMSMRFAQVQKDLAYAAKRKDGSDLDLVAWHFQEGRFWYEQAISEFEDHYLPMDTDLAARTNLAWCELGRLQCECASYALKGEPSLTTEVIRSHLTIKDLVGSMNGDDVQSFSQKWSRVRLPRGRTDAAGDKAFWEAAIFLTKHALPQLEPDELGNAISDLEQAGPFPVIPAKVQLNRLLESSGGADGPSHDETRRLLRCIAGLLKILRDVTDEEIARCDLRYNIEKLKEKTGESFSGLTGYHEPEGNYGLACFYASLLGQDKNMDDDYLSFALYYLMQAGFSSRFFIERARIDTDFYDLRQNEDFRALLEPPPAPGAEQADRPLVH